jgi:hypothetical protein
MPTPKVTDEQRMEGWQSRRLKAEDRFLGRLEKLEAAAEALVGELCREGVTVFYVNLKDRKGRFTGKTREGSLGDLIRYLIRNGYV